MPTLVVVGAQWGDEAKGKLVDVLGGEADMVVRYAGGNNAGHTVITGGTTYKFQLIPAAILHASTISVLGSGMVVCPKGLLEEFDRTVAQRGGTPTPAPPPHDAQSSSAGGGVQRSSSSLEGPHSSPAGGGVQTISSPQPPSSKMNHFEEGGLGTLRVSGAAHVVFPYHRMLDKLQEEARGENKIGTTSRGIGPAYEDKVARIGIRMSEFVHPERFHQRLQEVLSVKNRLLQMFGEQPLEFEALYKEYSLYADRIRPWVVDTEALIQNAVYSGKRVLFEGAQGTFLDLDSGTYPYVTSSHPVSGGACLGTGIGPRAIDSVLGVCKAYTTRVGAGPFPSELLDSTGELIREKAQEFGTVTGRDRRCGWLDLVVLKHSCRINSLSGLVLTRLDILSDLDQIKVVSSYRLNGEAIEHLPSDILDFAAVEPQLESLETWTGDLTGCRTFDALPLGAQKYVRFIEERTGTPVAVISVGPDRDQTIIVRPDLIWSESSRCL